LKIILFSPVRQEFDTLNLALGSHIGLKGVAERWYYDDNDSADSSDLLARARGRILDPIEAEKPDYDVTGETHAWTGKLVSRIARIRNLAIEEFLKTDADALFIVDSDLILHPSTVEHLAESGADVVSEVFWSKWRPEENWMPNVWDGHPYSFLDAESITRLRERGLYEVAGLGACTLIRREVFEKNVRYTPVSGLANIWGEDRWFSIRAAANDIRFYADTWFPPFHVYRKEQLEEARTWFECGCPFDYFRNTWLTDEWAENIEKNMAPKTAERPSLLMMLPGEMFNVAWVKALVELKDNLAPYFQVATQWGFVSNVYFMRKTMLDAAMTWEKRPDFILWIDDDQVLTVEGLKTLMLDLHKREDLAGVCGWAWCETNIYATAPMLSCGIFDRDGNVRRLEWDIMQNYDSDLIPISYSGFPAVLMRGSVLDAMTGDDFLPIIDAERFPPFGMCGEDTAFFTRANEKGLKFAVDRRVKVPHLKLRCAEPAAATSLEGVPVSKGEQ
jgi:hypothetical protein